LPRHRVNLPQKTLPAATKLRLAEVSKISSA
jgi:hypothetical protein